MTTTFQMHIFGIHIVESTIAQTTIEPIDFACSAKIQSYLIKLIVRFFIETKIENILPSGPRSSST